VSDHRFAVALRSLTESRRSVLGAAAAAALLSATERGMAKKKGKKKGKTDCPKGLKKINGRCARTCQSSVGCGRAGYCLPTYNNGNSGPAVCVLIGGLFALTFNEQCDLVKQRLCNHSSECGKNETCVVHGVCGGAYCAATRFP
jgi:hypothetical protein